jgi:DNA-binding CsgD family transcriptional regulator
MELSLENRIEAAQRRSERMRAFGDHLQVLQAQTGRSASQIAERGLSPKSVIAKMEKGKVDPRLSQLEALTRGLGIPMMRLLNEDTADLLEPAAVADDLSDREREVIRLIASGFTNPQIADEIQVALRTVKTYRARDREARSLCARRDRRVCTPSRPDLMGGRSSAPPRKSSGVALRTRLLPLSRRGHAAPHRPAE